MLSIIGTALLEVLGILLIATSIIVLAILCTLLILLVFLSVVYWAAYASYRKSWPYDRKFTEILWAHVIAASTGITMMLLLAFWIIADALGYYFLSVWAPILGYYVVALVIATNLHKFWTDGEVYKAKMYTAPAVQEVPPKADESIAEPVAATVEETNTLTG